VDGRRGGPVAARSLATTGSRSARIVAAAANDIRVVVMREASQSSATIRERCGGRGTRSAYAAGRITWDVSVDSSSARAHQHAAGARKWGPAGRAAERCPHRARLIMRWAAHAAG
jgi:hypothetical protein